MPEPKASDAEMPHYPDIQDTSDTSESDDDDDDSMSDTTDSSDAPVVIDDIDEHLRRGEEMLKAAIRGFSMTLGRPIEPAGNSQDLLVQYVKLSDEERDLAESLMEWCREEPGACTSAQEPDQTSHEEDDEHGLQPDGRCKVKGCGGGFP